MKKSDIINKESFDKEYFISTKDESGFLIYSSEPFKLSEIDFINLIKVCLIEARNKTIGRKILAIYRDSTEDRKKEVTKARLKMIGVEDEEFPRPSRERKPKIR
jgi:hypothetical protein